METRDITGGITEENAELRGDSPTGKPNSWQEFQDDKTGETFVKAVYDPSRDPNRVPPQSNAVGHAINGRRRALRMSQSDLGRRLGVSAALVGQWEKGKTRVDANDLGRLALALETTPTKLVGAIQAGGDVGWFPVNYSADSESTSAAPIDRARHLEQVLVAAFRAMTDEQRELTLRVVDAIRG